jgi:2-polyprenyl-3-methyl-5-hydroxy-6-metoxy-1,4-benzoquinol methylase
VDHLAIREKKKYDVLWSDIPSYRTTSPADIFAPIFLELFQDHIKPGERVIDFGCGPGRSVFSLLACGLQVDLVDLSRV